MTSRLDRLLGLIESGSSTSIKNVAAKQIGELTRYHTEELFYVLKKVSVPLYDKVWETRTASSLAISSIASFQKKYQPTFEGKKENEIISEEFLSFENFDVKEVIKNGKRLLASKSQQTEDISNDITLEEGEIKGKNTKKKQTTKMMTTEEFLEQETLSTRLLNRKKASEKRKLSTSDEASNEPPEKKFKTVVTEQPQTDDKFIMESVQQEFEYKNWPFESICKQFKKDLFSDTWEIRHGSAIGLREILKYHSESAGKNCHLKDENEQNEQNQKWLEDLSIRLLKVLILDRFSDYVSDKVVTPVKETCGQILGIILKRMKFENVKKVLENLLEMVLNEKWEISSSGLLGLKYSLAIRLDLSSSLLPMCLPTIINTLKQSDDDVRSIAADSLVPVVSHIIDNLSNESINEFCDILWNILIELDDLSASTSSVMVLLSQFYTIAKKYETLNHLFDNLDKLVPRLYPFLRHNLTTVRLSSIQTLDKLINGPNGKWMEQILSDLLRYVFQNIIFESKDQIIEESFKTWNSIMKIVEKENLVKSLNEVTKFWIYLVSTPYGSKFDLNLLLLPNSIKYSLQNASKSENQTFAIRLHFEDTEEFMKMRVNAAKALSLFVQSCDQVDLGYFFVAIESLFYSNLASHKQISALIVEELLKKRIILPQKLLIQFVNILEYEPIIYAEAEQYHSALHTDCIELLEFYQDLDLDVSNYLNVVITNSIANKLLQEEYLKCLTLIKDENQKIELNKLKDNVIKSLDGFKNMTIMLHSLVLSNVACAIVYIKYPMKIINSTLKSLLNSIQTQRSVILQERSSQSLTHLMIQSLKIEKIVQVILDTLTSKLCLTKNLEKKEILSENDIANRGCEIALQNITKQMGIYLIEKLPHLWKLTGEIFFNIEKYDDQKIEDALYILKTIIPTIEESLFPNLEPAILKILSIISGKLQLNAADTIGIFCKYLTKSTMKIMINHLNPLLSDQNDSLKRRGAAYTIEKIIDYLEFDILPYVVFFVIPLLKRMSDQDTITRTISSKCFGTIVKILPLEKAVPSIEGFEMQIDKERKFLEQLTNSKNIEHFEIPIKIKAELRKYQQDGVSWLAFLNKFNLSGILADDMGLGKTLQCLCILASDAENRKIENEKTNDCPHLPDLVVCPPTLVGHWNDEVVKFTNLNPIQYSGTPIQRKKIRDTLSDYDILITSYDILRNDISNFENLHFNYCVLDEGHIIRNSKTKITKSVKQIIANHRLILTGTPIQNNVIELWSLFDFLMPGFLGTESEFNKIYTKPILASREAKSNSKEQENGTLAMEALHRQVLPFLLRRVKEDVLKDLPEKIIQDYYVDMCPLQILLYEDFSKEEDETIKLAEKEKSQHVFHQLNYARKLCDHPLLVVNEKHTKYKEIQKILEKDEKTLHDISYSPKLQALSQLLKDSTAAEHRILIFCQLKSMLDIIENDLLKQHLKELTYMRLDGSVESNKRHEIVTKFNSDPTIDCLIMTTRVGGLGLNLTGADTVIFVEHDWNPQMDLQAMDRTHRIGQTKCVNVYRLITKDTIEEKIMSLQKFKLNISKSVVNRENSSFKSMDTNKLMNMFEKSDDQSTNNGSGTGTSGNKNEDDLWDENQYNEFDMSSYLKSNQ